MENNTGLKLLGGGIAVFVVIVVLFALLPFTVIGAGERGVVFNRLSGVENRILGEGVHFRQPFVESVVKMPVKTQVTNFEENAGTSDSQSVDIKVAVNWHLDPSQVNKIYQNTGDLDAVVSKVLTNNTQDAVKASISKYVALDIQRNRDKVANAAEDSLQEKVKRYNVIIENLSLTNVNFGADFNAAVENAQKANQEALAAQNKVKQVEAEARAAIAKAQGEAEAQRQVQQSLTPELLQKMWIEKWNGVLPSTDLGNTTPVFNLGH